MSDSKMNAEYFIGGGFWSKAWLAALVMTIMGTAATIAGYAGNPERFGYSYLFAFATVLTVGLGAMFFVVVQHLTAAGWSVTVRRTAEFFMFGLLVVPLLFLPVLGSLGEMYEWTHAAHAETESHGGHVRAPADPTGHARGAESAPSGGDKLLPPAEALHHELMAHKAGYLNVPFFLGRAAAYFAFWLCAAFLYFRWSTRQDATRDPHYTVKMQRWAPITSILLGLTLTFAAFDWLMSLEPTWYSTIFGAYVFASAAVAIHALVTVVTLSLRRDGHLGDSVNVEHYHDLGKLLFGFTCFWAYIGFSQMMLIWYAGIPEEATYYHQRWQGEGWRAVSIFLMLGHFALPFFFLISRVVKRRLGMLALGASWMLLMHVVDMYWFVMPNAPGAGLTLHFLDVTCLLAVGGAYLTVVFWLMRRYPLVPIGDPRLSRALGFQNA